MFEVISITLRGMQNFFLEKLDVVLLLSCGAWTYFCGHVKFVLDNQEVDKRG